MLWVNKRKLPIFALIAFVLILSSSFVSIVHSSQLQLEQGQVLQYKYARMSTSDQSQQTGDALYQILSFDQKMLSFQINAEALFKYTISYESGFPVYVDRLEALVYLPPESISQSLQGNLDWVSRVETRAQQNVANKTGETLNYTVGAGTFQCLNVTVAVAGPWDSGNLTLLYDVNSGILVYEQWIPEYGDVIVQYLSSTEYVQAPQQGALVTVLSIVLSSAVLATPVALAVHQTRKGLRSRRNPSPESLALTVVKSGFPKKAFIIAVVGASLYLASIFLPWSQTRESPTYLPFSLPPLLTQSAWVLPSNFTFTLISITFYAAAIVSWLGIALHLYKARKLTPQIAALASSVVAFVSVAFFVLSGWTYSWGFWVAVAGSVLTLVSLAAANVHVTIEMEPEETEEKTAESEEDEP
jgi:uncharacterized membrane protein